MFQYGFLIESLVSVLLLMTILYCVRLNNQIRLLKADEQSLRATIAELITATEIAERAIGGLKATMRESEQTLGERVKRADTLSADLGRQLESGELLLSRLVRITEAGRPDAMPQQPAPPRAQALAAAAQALAERQQARLKSAGEASGLAA
ncbi:DUF6468 domain-containing protein [Undibacter mobilis]|uniref:Chemotaxis protein n=1 Tax=Undibacter mobilis TaxID=2292256 RepID=A0A371BCF5_9BRAD|nr:DUF6468 domain-containing protein [Undibacter mobilis]RDV05197.1 chemotaxis protein [Undibacter mobilis]